METQNASVHQDVPYGQSLPCRPGQGHSGVKLPVVHQIQIGHMEGILPRRDIPKGPFAVCPVPAGPEGACPEGAVRTCQRNRLILRSGEGAVSDAGQDIQAVIVGSGMEVQNYPAPLPPGNRSKAIIALHLGECLPLRLRIHRHGDGKGVVPAVTDRFGVHRHGRSVAPLHRSHQAALPQAVLPAGFTVPAGLHPILRYDMVEIDSVQFQIAAAFGPHVDGGRAALRVLPLPGALQRPPAVPRPAVSVPHTGAVLGRIFDAGQLPQLQRAAGQVQSSVHLSLLQRQFKCLGLPFRGVLEQIGDVQGILPRFRRAEGPLQTAVPLIRGDSVVPQRPLQHPAVRRGDGDRPFRAPIVVHAPFGEHGLSPEFPCIQRID